MPGEQHSQPFRILFLSQRNTARGVMAEAIANAIGNGSIEAFSAGVRPGARVDPVAAELLQHAGLSVPGHAPQHVREFSAPDSPPLDFVFTLSDTAAGEAPPMWPGHPITAHWHCDDPAQYDDPTEKRQALIRTRSELERRLRVFANLPVRSLDRMSLQAHVESLGGNAHD
ncbi:MAG TPA: arsenate reductase ArsC [Steroidobacteraceae bacterium]|nr:arsenate reductase ArsC [Steroidobacteraceae bacterium]